MQSNTTGNQPKTAANVWWPPVTTIDEARNTAKQGAIAAAIVSGVTALFAILSLFGIELASIWALLDAGLFALVAFGIYKMSRTAAVIGLLLYVWEQISMLLATGKTNFILVAIFTLYLIHAVRGTFAYHKLKAQEPPPVIEEV